MPQSTTVSNLYTRQLFETHSLLHLRHGGILILTSIDWRFRCDLYWRGRCPMWSSHYMHWIGATVRRCALHQEPSSNRQWFGDILRIPKILNTIFILCIYWMVRRTKKDIHLVLRTGHFLKYFHRMFRRTLVYENENSNDWSSYTYTYIYGRDTLPMPASSKNYFWVACEKQHWPLFINLWPSHTLLIIKAHVLFSTMPSINHITD